MAYADYNYYVNDFRGNSIPQDKFDYLAERSSDFMDAITFDRLKNSDYSEYKDKVKKCCCALTEVISDYEKTRNNSEKASETIGSYSVTYKSVSDADYKMNLKNTACQYLIHTGLMYRGID